LLSHLPLHRFDFAFTFHRSPLSQSQTPVIGLQAPAFSMAGASLRSAGSNNGGLSQARWTSLKTEREMTTCGVLPFVILIWLSYQRSKRMLALAQESLTDSCPNGIVNWQRPTAMRPLEYCYSIYFSLQQRPALGTLERSVIVLFDPIQKEVRTWTHCELEGVFFVATITSMSTGQRNRAAVVECAYELRHYLLTAKDVVIQHVHMMCPPSLSGRSAWALEELESIVAYTGIDIDQSAVLYRTSVASYKLGELDLRKKKHSRVLFSTRHLKQHSPKASDEPYEERHPQMLAPLWIR
jgi:hypothetical protein